MLEKLKDVILDIAYYFDDYKVPVIASIIGGVIGALIARSILGL